MLGPAVESLDHFGDGPAAKRSTEAFHRLPVQEIRPCFDVAHDVRKDRSQRAVADIERPGEFLIGEWLAQRKQLACCLGVVAEQSVEQIH